MAFSVKHCFFLFVVLCFGFVEPIKVVSKSKNLILKEEAPATLWCTTDSEWVKKMYKSQYNCSVIELRLDHAENVFWMSPIKKFEL